MAVRVRRIRPGEGALLRGVRLAALSDSPLAFASTYDVEACRADDAWEADAVTRADGVWEAEFFAEREAVVAGLVGAYRSPEEPETVELVSMWVAPSARGQGLGERLVNAVVEWSLSAGAARVGLWVTQGNLPAITLYARSGFEPVATTQALPSNPCYHELRMARSLAAAAGP